MALPFSIINSIHSLFITPVTRQLGFSKTEFSLLFTISALTVAISSPIIGRLVNHLPIRLVMSIGTCLAGGGFLTYSFCTRITSFYLVAIIVAIGLTAITTIPVSYMLTRWFPKQKGTVLGIAFAGIGCGSLVFMQVASRLIQSKGYEFTYLFLGGLILLICLPICLIVVSLPTNKNSTVVERVSRQEKRSLPRNKVFLLFLGALFFLGITTSGIKVHIQPYLDESGYSLTHNANIGSLQSFVSLFSNLFAGKIFDQAGLRKSTILYGTMNFLAILCLIFIQFTGVPTLYAICFGLALSLPGLLPSYGVTALFPNNEYATTLGFSNCIFTIGSSFGPTVTGVFADNSLGYRGAWISYGVLIVFYLFLLCKATKLERARLTT